MCDFIWAFNSVKIFIFIFFIALAITVIPSEEILSFHYGQHVSGEQVSYIYNGRVPAFRPKYKLKVLNTKANLQKNFTYLNVVYYNALSNVEVLYDPEEMMLTFYIKYPFIDTSVAAMGYALPLPKVETQNTTPTVLNLYFK